MLEETVVQCPCCWESIVLAVDLSAGSTTYVEDCSVCCQPLVVRLQVEEGSGAFSVEVQAENS